MKTKAINLVLGVIFVAMYLLQGTPDISMEVFMGISMAIVGMGVMLLEMTRKIKNPSIRSGLILFVGSALIESSFCILTFLVFFSYDVRPSSDLIRILNLVSDVTTTSGILAIIGGVFYVTIKAIFARFHRPTAH